VHGQREGRQEPEGDTVTEAEVIERAEALPDRYANRVRPQDLDLPTDQLAWLNVRG